MDPIHLYQIPKLVKALTATKDAGAVQSAFNVVKNSKGPYKLSEFVNAAIRTKNPEAVKAVFKTFAKNKGAMAKALSIISSAPLHMLAPVVLPKEALQKLESMRQQGKTRKG